MKGHCQNCHFHMKKNSSSKNHLFLARNLVDWGSWTSWTVMLNWNQQLSRTHMWVLGRVCSSAGAAPKGGSAWTGVEGTIWLWVGVRQCQVAMWPRSTLKEVQARRRECGMGRDMAPRHDRLTHGQARLDVPHPASTNPVNERRPGLKAPGCSWSEFLMACMSEMSGTVLTLLGLTLLCVSAMEQSGMKDKSVASPSLPLSLACLHLCGQQGCLLLSMSWGTSARARAGSKALGKTLPLPWSGKATVPAQSPASCARGKGQQSSVWGQLWHASLGSCIWGSERVLWWWQQDTVDCFRQTHLFLQVF